MFKRIVLVSAILTVLCVPISSQVTAQSREDAMRLHREAHELREKARSNDDLKKAADKYEEALSIYRKGGDSKDAALVCQDLGIIHSRWGQDRKAVEYYEKGLEITRKIGDEKTEGLLNTNLGPWYRDLGEYQRAVKHLETGLEIARNGEDGKKEGWILNSLGLCYFDLGQYQKAAEFYEKGLEIARKNGDVHLPLRYL